MLVWRPVAGHLDIIARHIRFCNSFFGFSAENNWQKMAKSMVYKGKARPCD
jgi:hypothetical protein